MPFGLYVPAINFSIFNSTDGFNGSDRGAIAEQDGFAYFGELTFQLTDNWDITVGYRQHDQDNQNWNENSPAARLRARRSCGPSRSARAL